MNGATNVCHGIGYDIMNADIRVWSFPEDSPFFESINSLCLDLTSYFKEDNHGIPHGKELREKEGDGNR